MQQAFVKLLVNSCFHKILKKKYFLEREKYESRTCKSGTEAEVIDSTHKQRTSLEEVDLLFSYHFLYSKGTLNVIKVRCTMIDKAFIFSDSLKE